MIATGFFHARHCSTGETLFERKKKHPLRAEGEERERKARYPQEAVFFNKAILWVIASLFNGLL